MVVISTSVGGTNGYLKPAVDHALSVSDVYLIFVIHQDYCPEASWYRYIEIGQLMTTLEKEESVGGTCNQNLSAHWVRVVTGNLLQVHRSRFVEVDCDVDTGGSPISTTDPGQCKIT